MQHPHYSSLSLSQLSLLVIEELAPLVSCIARRDKSLADQLRRAASSACLNLHEANYSDPGNARARLFTAAGSANETRAALRIAVAWGYLSAAQTEHAEAKLDRLIARLYGLTRK